MRRPNDLPFALAISGLSIVICGAVILLNRPQQPVYVPVERAEDRCFEEVPNTPPFVMEIENAMLHTIQFAVHGQTDPQGICQYTTVRPILHVPCDAEVLPNKDVRFRWHPAFTGRVIVIEKIKRAPCRSELMNTPRTRH